MKILKWLLLLGGLSLISAFVVFNVISYKALWQIKHKPLPPIARGAVRYSVRDAGAATTDQISFHSWGDERFTWQLTDEGKVSFDEAGASARRQFRLKQGSERLQQLGLPAQEFTSVHDVHGEWTLIHRGELELWRGKTLIAVCPMSVEDYAGWPTPTGLSHFFGASNEIMGSSRIATAFASSGGVSSPHGRDFPFVWDGKSRFLRDLNSEIDAQDGWYLYSALATNNSGQILCLGEQTDALSAETSDREKSHKIILTPVKR